MSQSRSTPALVSRAPVPESPLNEHIAGYMQAGIWGVVLLLILASLPRAYMRWRHPSIRKHGIQLKTGKTGASAAGTITPDAIPHLPARPPQADRTESVNSVDKKSADGVDVRAGTASATPPLEGNTVGLKVYSRVASWGSIFWPAYRLLDIPVWWVGYSVGLSLAFAVYTGMVSFGIFYHNLPSFGPRRCVSGLSASLWAFFLTFPCLYRAGWVVVGQIPFIIFLGTKNNLLGFVLGMGYEKVCILFLIPNATDPYHLTRFLRTPSSMSGIAGLGRPCSSA